MGTFTNSTYTATIQSLITATESKINNPYYKFSDKKPTECTYFKQNREKSTLDETTALNYSHVGEDSPIKFNQINGFYIYGFDKITLDYDVTDFGLESGEITGDVVVLPNTIIPLPGDFFKVTAIKEDVLFKVNKVTPDTLDNGSNFYKIEYKLELVNQYENILKQVVATYNFIIENVGTDFSCLISSENYTLATEMATLFQQLVDAYQLFFDPSVQTFVCDYNGSKMYDPYLIEFLIRNNVLSSADNYIYVNHAMAVSHTFDFKYSKTFFAMIEDTSLFNIYRATKPAHAFKIEDPNSLFVTRLEDYYAIDYFDRNVYVTSFNPIDVTVMQNIGSGTTFNETDTLAPYNILISYFNDDNSSVAENIIDLLRNTEIENNMMYYYLIPIAMYILTKYTNNLLSDTSSSV
jgi:hypothetical protein